MSFLRVSDGGCGCERLPKIDDPKQKEERKKPLFIPNHKKVFFLADWRRAEERETERTPDTRAKDEARGQSAVDGAER